MLPNGGPGVGDGDAEGDADGDGDGDGEGLGFAARACVAHEKTIARKSGISESARLIERKASMTMQ
jgi:hypothetical protein